MIPSSAPGARLGLIDLAAKRIGGMVIAANDEYFAAKENLLDPAPPRFDPARYSDRGKEMDGWETRRRRDDGNDWCVVRLGIAGVLEEVAVDTTYFRGNYPDEFSLEGCVIDAAAPGPDTDWFTLVGRTHLQGDTLQRFPVEAPWQVTHVRLSIYPDGGVARLRLLGRPLVDLHTSVGAGDRLDLAASVSGGRAVACSDDFFSSPNNLVSVGDARDMGDGWETRRRRGPGEDFAIIELTTSGVIERVEIDTTHFKGNYPDRCAIDTIHVPGADADDLPDDGWVEVVEPSPMEPHARHVFDVVAATPASHLRLRVIPDGGVARLRAFGTITEDGWIRAGLAVLNARTPSVAAGLLLRCCGSSAWAAGMAARRPFRDPTELGRVADELWAALGTADHLEAFAAHPRIGERSAARWSSQEQAGAAASDTATLDALAEANRVYEDRFGHVFLIFATGKSATEMLSALEERLGNDAATELRIAAEEQRKITRLRLDKLLRDGIPD